MKFLVCPLLLLAVACVAPSLYADDARPMAPKYEVKEVKDISYYNGKEADPKKHKLDLYLPKERKDFPVLFFVHGGGWKSGDRNYFGVYSAIGKFFARHGIGTVVISYRLSPAVQHPEHIKDVARAFAWTCKNIATYGGNAEEIFISGHSAGGHLVALLACDESYLKAEGLTCKNIRAVIPLSGVYILPPGTMPSVFTRDAEVHRKAGPIEHVKAGLPPFFILYADKDFAGCGRVPSEAFCKTLVGKKVEAKTLEIKNSNHLSIIRSASVEGDAVTRAMLAFIEEHNSPTRR